LTQPDTCLLLHCTGCGRNRPRGWFARSGEGRRSSWCRECRRPGKLADAARRRGAGVAKISKGLIARLLAKQRRICPLCRLPIALGAKFHVDHRLSVARGGKHEESNLQIAHARCNLMAGSKIK